MTLRSTSLRAALLVLVAAGAGFGAYEMTRREGAISPAQPPTGGASAPAASSAARGAGGAPTADSGPASASNPDEPPTADRPPPIPGVLPDFSLPDENGVPRQLSHWRDQPLMVNFWATWCVPCRREIPLLRELRADRRADRLEVVGIAVDERAAVLDYAHKIGIDYPILIGEQEGMDAAAALGMDTVFPFTVFADRKHRIVAAKVGELHADEANFILDRVRDIDAGHLDLAAARALISNRVRDLAVARAQHEVK
jgi:thiol-disulfide isomerase/thioredoxin